jgi:addiction module RelB/DinJ family antitoxin
MAPTTIRIDEKIKKEARKLAEKMGFSFNDLVNVLIKKAVREGGVDLRNVTLTENMFTPEFEESILKAEKEGGAMEFKSVDEMVKHTKNEN